MKVDPNDHRINMNRMFKWEILMFSYVFRNLRFMDVDEIVCEHVFDKDMCQLRMLAAPFSELFVIGIE